MCVYPGRWWGCLWGGLLWWCSRRQLQAGTGLWGGCCGWRPHLVCIPDPVQLPDSPLCSHTHLTHQWLDYELKWVDKLQTPGTYLCRTLRTFQPSSTPLLLLAFWAMVDTVLKMAAPSSLCRALLPTMTTGRFAAASVWRETNHEADCWRLKDAWGCRCVYYLAEGVCAVSQLLQHWRLLSQVLVGVAQIDIVTHHGDTKLIVEPARKGGEGPRTKE